MTIQPYSGDADWPTEWQGSRFTGRFVSFLGDPMVGTITFTPSVAAVISVASKVIVAGGSIPVPLDANGAFDVILPATDDPDTNPTGWTYAVSEGWAAGRKYSVAAPMNVTQDLTAVVPVPSADGVAIVRGMSAYEVAVANGYTGTEAEFVDGMTSTSSTPATTTTKGIVKLAGDLSGTADLPTVPGLASKVDNTRAVNSGTGLTGGGALNADRTLAVDFAGAGVTTAGKVVNASDARLSDARTPSGGAGGDLSGTYPNPAVAKVNGVAVSGTPTAGQVLTASSGTAAAWSSPSGGVDATAVHLAGTETVTGTKTFTGGLTISTSNLTITDKDIVLSTTTGTKIGTTTSQKLGFFNATPVAQQGATADLGQALSNLGLRQGGNYTLSTFGNVDFNGTVTLAATTFNSSITTKGTNQNAGSLTLGAHHKVLCNTSTGNVTVTLPTAVGIVGREYIIVKGTGDANVVAIASAGGTINGQTGRNLTRRYESVNIVSDGANWIIVAQGEPVSDPTYPIGSAVYTNPVGKGTAAAVNDTKAPCTPFPVPRTMQVNELRFRQQTVADGGNMHISIYASDAQGRPTGSPLYTTTAIAANSGAGMKAWTGLAWNLTPGMYWLAFGSYGYTTTKALPGILADPSYAHTFMPLTTDPTWTPGFRLSDYNDTAGTWPTGTLNIADINGESAWWYNIRGVLA